jgi:dolichol-phosphate mannosyltransferase
MNDMLKAHFEEGYEIVAGERSGRDESAYRIVTSRIFYALMRKLSFPNLPRGGFDYVLLSRRVVNLLLKNREAHAFFQGQILWTGFRPKFIPYFRKEREVGISRWSFGRKLTYLIDGTMGYSFFPIRFISIMGVLFAFLGFLYAVLIFVLKLFGGIPVTGWAPLMIVILVMGGFQMLMLGVIGEYLWRALAQVRNRDPYVIETVYENVDSPAPGGGEGPRPGP